MNHLLRVSGLLAMTMTAATANLHQFRLANSETEARLPQPMSDMSAVVGPDDLIYLAGGCDSPFGSQFNEDAGAFRCGSVSNSFYSFDPATQEFNVLPIMPEPRYRHAAVAINNQIWLVGGRNVDDELVGNVHVYDLEDMRWRTFRDLHDTYWLSDLGGFTAGGRAYFVGGFTEDYRAVRKVWSIQPEESWEEGELSIVRHANLVNRRGDVGVTVDSQERYAYVSGGSSHTNAFCEPLSSVEQYDLIFNHWLEVAPLTQGRTGKTVIQLDDQMVALGGAQQIQKHCNKTLKDPSDIQTPVYEVEVYDQAEWNVVDSLSDYRFRSTTVVFNGTVYSFGGQSVYFSVCECHPTVDTIVTYEQVKGEPQAGEQPGGFFANDNNYDFNIGQEASMGEEQPDIQQADGSEYYYYDSPGSDSINEDTEDVEDPQYIEERINFEGEQDSYASVDEEYENEADATETGSTQSGFGTYHRDKSKGFIDSGSASRKVSTRFLFAVSVAMIAAIAL